MKNIKLIRLTSGEEIICEYVTSGHVNSYGIDAVTVRKPFAVGVQGGSVVVFPWCLSTFKASDEDTFDIFLHSIVMIASAPQEMVDSYIEQTTNLSVPSEADKRIILG